MMQVAVAAKGVGAREIGRLGMGRQGKVEVYVSARSEQRLKDRIGELRT